MLSQSPVLARSNTAWNGTMPIALLCLDVSEIVIAAMSQILAGSKCQIAGTFDSRDGVSKIKSLGQFDVALLEMRRPNSEVLRVVHQLRSKEPKLPILLFSAYDNPTFLVMAAQAGVCGFVSKGSISEELVSALVALSNGGTAWHRNDLRRMNGVLSTVTPSTITHNDDEILLTDREREVLRMVVDGATNKEIASEFCLATETIKDYVRSILDKTGLSDRTQVALWALANKLF